jgi:hypothetical protein
MMRFEFELQPLADVQPWGNDRPTYHWFGLTSGWYRIEVDGRQLPRYGEKAVRRWNLSRPFPDYYVARFWEDLIVLRWALSEPVPVDVAPFVDGGFAPREFAEDVSADADTAFRAQDDYQLDLGYLTDAPMISCRRHVADGRDAVIVGQRIRPDRRDTFEGSELLELGVPTAEFFAAMDDFDRRFIAAMDERVAELERTGPAPGVVLDVKALRDEHASRSRWLADRLSVPREVDWDRVRSGIAEISSWPVGEA